MTAVVLILLASGLAFAEPLLIVAGVLPLAFVAYSAGTSTASPGDTISVEREISPTKPLPGEPTTVTVRAENESDWPIADLRIVDGVPDELYVGEGSVHSATALRSESVHEFEYVVRPRRGTFEIGSPLVRFRSVSGSVVATEAVTVSGDSTIECQISAENVPIHRQTIRRTGTLESAEPGDGSEFHSTREYQLGDPINRIDWRRYARTGELATVQFREEEATTVVLCVDARESSHVSHDVGHPTGATLAAYATVATMGALITDGQRVGVAAFGLSDRNGSTPDWVPPGRDGETIALATELCSAATTSSGSDHVDPSTASEPESVDHSSQTSATVADGGSSRVSTERSVSPDAERSAPDTAEGVDGGGRNERNDGVRRHRPDSERTRFLSLLPPRAQVLYCSPLLEDAVVDDLMALTVEGYDGLVLSPRVTNTGTVGGHLADARRDRRIAELRLGGVHVIDWDVDDPLQIALTRALSTLGDRG